MTQYELAREGMTKMLEIAEEKMDFFKRKSYADAFTYVYQKYVPYLDALEELHNSVKEPDTLMEQMAGFLAESAVERVNKRASRKSSRGTEEINVNMMLCVYIFPSILKYKGNCSQPLVDAIQKAWKEAFPKSNVHPAEAEYIESGFHHKWCYITTAVCKELRRGDDCYELQLLRHYRDTYMQSLPDGEALIEQYYDMAPTIVKHIYRSGHADRIYHDVWNHYLSPCISLIEQNRQEECRLLYTRMVEELREQYF